ncbi:sigma-70 family RNA polymerase sigma factor [Bacillus kwashiorkori]|uniref:sigma-70 family RNA polymerase sigma factor n=1 Tax=Bacillus kwashiorkori TaxID=1522318 RepID=UPI001EF15ACA|nr:sigma-70 family RNA polymerase sigma factor [Bacillus kwashiorkori]
MPFSDVINPTIANVEQDILQMEKMEAIEMIMDLYGDEVKRFVFTYVKNIADTEDVTQEVLILVYEKLHTFKGNSKLRSWLFAIAANKCKDYLRSWQGRNKKLTEKIKNAFSYHDKSMETPESVTLRHQENQQVFQKVLQLPVKYREIIILYYFHDLTLLEISNSLQIKPGTVRTRLARGREKLKQWLAEIEARDG